MKTYFTVAGTIVGYTAILIGIAKNDEKNRKIKALKARNAELVKQVKASHRTLTYAYDELKIWDREAAHKMNETYDNEYEFQSTIRNF